jgi:hypothetical protein
MMAMLGILSSKTKSNYSSTILKSPQIALDALEVMHTVSISTIALRKMVSACLLCYWTLDMKELKLPPSVKYNGNGLKMLSRAMGKKTI